MAAAAHGQGVRFFHITSKLSGLVLDVSGNKKDPGTKVHPWAKKPPATGDNQLWYEDPKTGTIRAKLTGFCLDIPGDMLVVTPFKPGNPNQLWFLSKDNRIQNRHQPSTVIEIAGANPQRGAKVCAGTNAGTKNQLWSFDYAPATPASPPVRCFFICSELNNRVLDVRGAGTAAGTEVVVYTRNSVNTDNQLWYMDGQGVIRSKLNNMALDVSGGKVKMQPYKNGNKNQTWTHSEKRIINNAQPGQVLGIQGAKNADGIGIVMEMYAGGKSQHWHLMYI